MSVSNTETGISVRPLDGPAMVVMVLLSLVWGFNQVAVKVAIPDIPPLTQGFFRAVISCAIIYVVVRVRRVDLSLRDGTLGPGLLLGLVFALEFICIYQGLLYTTATRAVLFLYISPFVVAILARWLTPADRFSPLQWAGLAFSFVGMVLAFGLPTPALDPRQALGDALICLASASWAASTLFIKVTVLNRTPPEKTLLYQLAVSVPVFAIAVPIFGEQMTPNPSALAIGSVIYQGIVVASLSFFVWFAMVQRYSASRLSAFTFLTPLFGVAIGWLTLGDPVTLPFLFAVLCVVAGLVLVNRR